MKFTAQDLAYKFNRNVGSFTDKYGWLTPDVLAWLCKHVGERDLDWWFPRPGVVEFTCDKDAMMFVLRWS